MKAPRSEHHGRVAADLTMLTRFQGVPAEFRGFLAMVLLRRVEDRLSANLEALGCIAADGHARGGRRQRMLARQAGSDPWLDSTGAQSWPEEVNA